ncbi:hypothetical protein Nepgr_030659 [Nepenthes gracilis]|uniref:Uncharacterized protein n=1 Tax=Nepenthes gracilis TaxID=150966 RepID=A0AAD3Y6S9_NEPGR|nr:hypothetical protein Nepgr_030659 [Nepenthes gracilis]
MQNIARKGIHYLQNLNAANVPADLIAKGQNQVIDASLTLIRERAKLKVLLEDSIIIPQVITKHRKKINYSEFYVRNHRNGIGKFYRNAFQPLCRPAEQQIQTGKELNDPRVLTDVGDVPAQEIRDCGIDNDRLMNVISKSVKLVMEEMSMSCTH